MKTLLILSALFLLSSCTEYRYDVTYEKCNGQTGSISAVSNNLIEGCRPVIGNNILSSTNCGFAISNVCDFSYTKSAITP